MKYRYFLIIIPIIAIGCYYDNEETLYPGSEGDCDTTQVTFTLDIQPILSNYCYACHSNQNAPDNGNNIRLENYTDVKSMSGSIIEAINHNPPFTPMPFGEGKLNDCLINQFEAWVNQGLAEK